jgi:hypothetical protein
MPGTCYYSNILVWIIPPWAISEDKMYHHGDGCWRYPKSMEFKAGVIHYPLDSQLLLITQAVWNTFRRHQEVGWLLTRHNLWIVPMTIIHSCRKQFEPHDVRSERPSNGKAVSPLFRQWNWPVGFSVHLLLLHLPDMVLISNLKYSPSYREGDGQYLQP